MFRLSTFSCKPWIKICHHLFIRHLSVSQTATALRPFYFAVHPDLFGRYPRERHVNEESLKTLHEYVATLQSHGNAQPIDLIFYIRPHTTYRSDLKDVKVTLQSKDIRKTVRTILEACGLPLDYINNVQSHSKSQFPRPIDWHHSYYAATGQMETRPKAPPQKTLKKWLMENIGRVRSYSDTAQLIQSDIDILSDKIVSKVGLKSVRWENIWGKRHYMGCLGAFYKLCQGRADALRFLLQDRTLVFGNKTGVNLHGEIVLGSEDVPTEWMSLISTVKAYEPMIERLPKMEEELSLLLNGIQIIRRQSQEVVMAQTYEVLLNRMLNSVRRSQEEVLRGFRMEDLSHLVMVVESESGPLALTANGQFLIPASIPASLMIKFIVENKTNAATFLIDAKMHMFYMDQIMTQCRDELKLISLARDDSITPQQVTECCQNIIDNFYDLNHLLQGTKLKISTYYTVMRDGEITIPWNWLADK